MDWFERHPAITIWIIVFVIVVGGAWLDRPL
jgi:hypothetical protein